jgi:hypothetical protein
MSLRRTEIACGVVAYFDHRVLIESTEVDRPDDAINRPGPFVCVQTVGDKSVWSGLTTKSDGRPERLYLRPEWRTGGEDRWREDDQFLNDGLATYLGPTSVFVAAAAAERPFGRFTRPHVTSAGIAAIIGAITEQGGWMLDEHGQPYAT